ncbi:unnamed protein product, partial [Phaeothamnion confervicola]
MVMENFKSYGGVREIGPFHKCFSSIVGPNGSGKSNVIDAMLFVFGKNAKKLRLNKVSELIHRSDAFPNLQHTNVAVHFIDIVDVPSSDDGYEMVPKSELIVSRTAYLDNTSKYRVDGRVKTFKEVGALLRERGIDLDNNRFLILQGEVEQIAMMKPRAATEHETGLLEYLEDIIGSNRYVDKTAEAAKAVEELDEQRRGQVTRLRQAEGEKEILEPARATAEVYARKEAVGRHRRNVLYQARAAGADAAAAKAAEAAAAQQEAYDMQEKELQEAEAAQKELSGRYETITAEFRKITTRVEKSFEDFKEYERKDIKLNEDKKFLEGQRRKLQVAAEKDAKRQAERRVIKKEGLEASVPGLQQAVEQAKRRKADDDSAFEAVTAELGGKTAALRQDLETRQAEAAPVRAEADALRNSIKTAKCEVTLLEESAADAKRELARAEGLRKEAAAAAARNRVALAAAEAEAAALGGADAAKAAAAVEAAAAAETAAAAVAAKALAAAEEAKAAREADAGRGVTVRRLLAAAKPGGPLAGAGVRGRLGDLGSIADEHDVAVSTACGYLDHIVVETAADGAACVEFLRANDVGRASFVILEQLGHLASQMARPFAARGGCPRLYDLVRPADDRYRPAFYLGLRDTLVAPNLDVAVAVAYKGGRCVARVVTRDGQLIDQSGAMSGGGGAARRGGMGSSGAAAAAAAAGNAGVTEREAAAAAEAATAAEAALREARAEKRRREDAVKALKRREEQ